MIRVFAYALLFVSGFSMGIVARVEDIYWINALILFVGLLMQYTAGYIFGVKAGKELGA